MSHQPSTTDKLKTTANSAYDSVVNTINPSDSQNNTDPNQDPANFKKDANGNTAKKGDLKDKLNEAAFGVPREPEPTYVEKVMSSIPGVNKLQQMAFDQGESEKETQPPGPPERPDHDVQVEQFLRKQYHSKSGDGMPDPDAK